MCSPIRVLSSLTSSYTSYILVLFICILAYFPCFIYYILVLFSFLSSLFSSSRPSKSSSLHISLQSICFQDQWFPLASSHSRSGTSFPTSVPFHLFWRLMLQVDPKYSYPSAKWHGVTTRKTVTLNEGGVKLCLWYIYIYIPRESHIRIQQVHFK